MNAAQVAKALALQWGHAFVSVETHCDHPPSLWRALLQWGQAFVSVETGKRLSAYDVARIVLQWGHAFVSVETGVACNSASSVNSLQWGHAFVSVETRAKAA